MTTKRENKWCFVPGCKNTSKNSNKKFVSVPMKEERRLKWFEAVGRKMYATKTVFFCCEDHFNVSIAKILLTVNVLYIVGMFCVLITYCIFVIPDGTRYGKLYSS